MKHRYRNSIEQLLASHLHSGRKNPHCWQTPGPLPVLHVELHHLTHLRLPTGMPHVFLTPHGVQLHVLLCALLDLRLPQNQTPPQAEWGPCISMGAQQVRGHTYLSLMVQGLVRGFSAGCKRPMMYFSSSRWTTR